MWSLQPSAVSVQPSATDHGRRSTDHSPLSSKIRAPVSCEISAPWSSCCRPEVGGQRSMVSHGPTATDHSRLTSHSMFLSVPRLPADRTRAACTTVPPTRQYTRTLAPVWPKNSTFDWIAGPIHSPPETLGHTKRPNHPSPATPHQSPLTSRSCPQSSCPPLVLRRLRLLAATPPHTSTGGI